MRGPAFLLLLAGMVSQEPARKMATVAQVEQMLAASGDRQDAFVAERLAGVELTERVSSARLLRWEGQAPGNRTREALVALADESVFLDLPVAELPDVTVPDVEMQRQILSRAADYVKRTIPKLPNFLATRETKHFEDGLVELSAAEMRSSGGLVFGYKPLHFVGASAATVAYRDGREVPEQTDGQKAGLTTSGEFGPVLRVALVDAAGGEVTWGHWEKGEERGLLAVFRYRVPQERSHYEVTFPDRSWRPLKQFPAFHGEIAVDPESGSVLRLTIVSDLQAPYQKMVSDIAVEYGSVTIGEGTFICPVRGVALSRVRMSNNREETLPVSLKAEVNDVSFTHYQLFRAESRIVTDGERQKKSLRVDAPTAASETSAVTDVQEPATSMPARKRP